MKRFRKEGEILKQFPTISTKFFFLFFWLSGLKALTTFVNGNAKKSMNQFKVNLGYC